MVSTGPVLRDEGSNGDSVWLGLVFLTFGNGVGVLRAFSLLGGWHWARCQGSRSSGDQVGRIWPLVAFWALAFLWRRGFLEREIRVVVRWRGLSKGRYEPSGGRRWAQQSGGLGPLGKVSLGRVSLGTLYPADIFPSGSWPGEISEEEMSSGE